MLHGHRVMVEEGLGQVIDVLLWMGQLGNRTKLLWIEECSLSCEVLIYLS